MSSYGGTRHAARMALVRSAAPEAYASRWSYKGPGVWDVHFDTDKETLRIAVYAVGTALWAIWVYLDPDFMAVVITYVAVFFSILMAYIVLPRSPSHRLAALVLSLLVSTVALLLMAVALEWYY